MKQNQRLLRIQLPHGQRVYPSTFRGLLAKEPHLPNALFHRDENRRTLNGRPGIRVAGAVGWVGLVADPGFEQLVTEATGAAIMAVTGYVGRPCPVVIENPEFNITTTDRPITYWVREMAIKRRHPSSRNSKIEPLIAQRILTSIEACCDKYGFDCPTSEQLGIEVVNVFHQRGVRIQVEEELGPLKNGMTNEFATLVDAEVIIHAELAGHWFAGNLTSRGYGRLIKPVPGMRREPQNLTEVLR